jgi:hypothetical protein
MTRMARLLISISSALLVGSGRSYAKDIEVKCTFTHSLGQTNYNYVFSDPSGGKGKTTIKVKRQTVESGFKPSDWYIESDLQVTASGAQFYAAHTVEKDSFTGESDEVLFLKRALPSAKSEGAVLTRYGWQVCETPIP